MNEVTMIKNIRIFIGVFVMSSVLTGCDQGTDFSNFEALKIARTGSFELDMSPGPALLVAIRTTFQPGDDRDCARSGP